MGVFKPLAALTKRSDFCEKRTHILVEDEILGRTDRRLASVSMAASSSADERYLELIGFGLGGTGEGFASAFLVGVLFASLDCIITYHCKILRVVRGRLAGVLQRLLWGRLCFFAADIDAVL